MKKSLLLADIILSFNNFDGGILRHVNSCWVIRSLSFFFSSSYMV